MHGNPDGLIQLAKMNQAISLIFPLALFTDSTATILDPMKKTTRTIVQKPIKIIILKKN